MYHYSKKVIKWKEKGPEQSFWKYNKKEGNGERSNLRMALLSQVSCASFIKKDFFSQKSRFHHISILNSAVTRLFDTFNAWKIKWQLNLSQIILSNNLTPTIWVCFLNCKRLFQPNDIHSCYKSQQLKDELRITRLIKTKL